MGVEWKLLSRGAKLRRAHTLFWWALVAPVVVAFLAYSAVASTLRAQSILQDHAIIAATLSIDSDAPPSRQLTKFKYTYEVDGKLYSGPHVALNSRATDIQPGSTIKVAYARSDPGRSQPADRIAQNADLTANLRSVVVTALIALVLVGLCWMVVSILVNKLAASLE